MKLIVMVLPVICLIFLAIDGYAFNCSVTSTAVNFGSYNVFSSSPLDSTGTITITCNNPEKKPMPVTISISSGVSGSFNPRQMRLAGGADRMNYYLFSDPSKTVIWGDGTGGSSSITRTIDRNPNLTATVYGRVPAKQDLRAGTYSDTLVVTVIW